MVSRGPNYNADSQSITFWVRDDTGEIMATAFRDQALPGPTGCTVDGMWMFPDLARARSLFKRHLCRDV